MGTLLQEAKDTGEQLDWSPFGIAAAQVSKLKRAALTGDAEAATALVKIASSAVSALDWIWWGWDCETTSPEYEKRREPKREMLRQIAKKRDSWPVSYHCREGKRKDTAQMMKELGLGTGTPLKVVGVEDGMMLHWVTCLSYEIGNPTAENAREWPRRALEWMDSFEGIRTALRDPKTWLYELANPERQKKKRRSKAIKALNRWENKTKKRHRSRKLSVEEAEAKMERLKRINSRDVVSEGDIVSGFKEAIAAYLRENINPQI